MPTASVCGFSFGRNLTRLHYPVEAAVRSVLPLCDRFIFVAGRSEDDTHARVARIDSKVQVIDSVWPEVKVDGTVLAIEANKALAAAEASGCTWGFYIQADEVVHEDDLPQIRAATDHWARNPRVKALLFRYLHFYLDYRTIDPWGYHKACRVIRLDGTCEIAGDACGPALRDYHGTRTGPDRGRASAYLDKHHLGGQVRWARHPDGPWCSRPARIFHYGWVKTPRQLDDKLEMVEDLWWGTLPAAERNRQRQEKFPELIQRYRILKRFRGSHPALMRERVAAHGMFARTRVRWLQPAFYRAVLTHGFKG
jgi:hypothetical protein